MTDTDNKEIDILIVDDVAPARRIVTRMLGILGYSKFREASGVNEAFDLLKKEPARLVITDLHLKDGLGTELLTRVRGDDNLKKTQTAFIIITSDMDKGAFKDAVDAGVTSYLLKPFSPQLLAERVSVALGKKKPS